MITISVGSYKIDLNIIHDKLKVRMSKEPVQGHVIEQIHSRGRI